MKTYEFGLLQTAAFRGLKGHTYNLLKPFGITTYEWAILGLLYEQDKGYTYTGLSKKLQVSKPFITKAIKKLLEKELVQIEVHQSDKRSGRISLSKKGLNLVPKIESHLKKETAFVFKGINKLQLLAYVLVLNKIVNKLQSNIEDLPPPIGE